MKKRIILLLLIVLLIISLFNIFKIIPIKTTGMVVSSPEIYGSCTEKDEFGNYYQIGWTKCKDNKIIKCLSPPEIKKLFGKEYKEPQWVSVAECTKGKICAEEKIFIENQEQDSIDCVENYFGGYRIKPCSSFFDWISGKCGEMGPSSEFGNINCFGKQIVETASCITPLPRCGDGVDNDKDSSFWQNKKDCNDDECYHKQCNPPGKEKAVCIKTSKQGGYQGQCMSNSQPTFQYESKNNIGVVYQGYDNKFKTKYKDENKQGNIMAIYNQFNQQSFVFSDKETSLENMRCGLSKDKQNYQPCSEFTWKADYGIEDEDLPKYIHPDGCPPKNIPRLLCGYFSVKDDGTIGPIGGDQAIGAGEEKSISSKIMGVLCPKEVDLGSLTSYTGGYVEKKVFGIGGGMKLRGTKTSTTTAKLIIVPERCLLPRIERNDEGKFTSDADEGLRKAAAESSVKTLNGDIKLITGRLGDFQVLPELYTMTPPSLTMVVDPIKKELYVKLGSQKRHYPLTTQQIKDAVEIMMVTSRMTINRRAKEAEISDLEVNIEVEDDGEINKVIITGKKDYIIFWGNTKMITTYTSTFKKDFWRKIKDTQCLCR